MEKDFMPRNSSANFQSRASDIFSQLSRAVDEKDYTERAAARSRHRSPSPERSDRNLDPPVENTNFFTTNNNNNQGGFKRPIMRPARRHHLRDRLKLRAEIEQSRGGGTFVAKDPKKWTRYDLGDIKMTNNSENSAAAFDFLQSIGHPTPAASNPADPNSSGSLKFTRPETSPYPMEADQQNARPTSSRGPHSFTTKEYVIGEKRKAEKPKNQQKPPANQSPSSSSVLLSHLDDPSDNDDQPDTGGLPPAQPEQAKVFFRNRRQKVKRSRQTAADFLQ